MGADWEVVRRECIQLAKSRHCRRTDWSPQVPCEWKPQTVWNPSTEMFFTDAGAWDYIIELLESGLQFSEVQNMRKPPGTVGYEVVTKLAPNLPDLYIKIQVYKGRIWGRSFHNSTR
jgi:hypothetical protein